MAQGWITRIAIATALAAAGTVAPGCTRDDGRTSSANPPSPTETGGARPAPVLASDAALSARRADAALPPIVPTTRCRVAREVQRAIDGESEDASRAKLTAALKTLASPAEAERRAKPTVERVVRALAKRDFGALSTLMSQDGLCLEPAKGADCVKLPVRAVATCGRARKRTEWAIDTGRDDYPRYTCSQAFDEIFLTHPKLLDAKPGYNCFPPRADNNAVPILDDFAPNSIYVELHAPELEPTNDPKTGQPIGAWHGWLSLWIVLVPDNSGTLRVHRLISHYWGI